jgi:hypothetical protein
VSTLHRNRGDVRAAGRAYAYPHLAPWLIAAVLLVMAAAALIAVTVAATPSGPLDMPIPQPAPVGP